MTTTRTRMPPSSQRAVLWLAAIAGLILVSVANAHLVYVAMRSQPDCVPHVRVGEGGSGRGFGAAASACTPGAPVPDPQPARRGAP